MITQILDKIDSVMYYPILIIVMALAGIYFTILTKGVQIRLFPESVRLLKEPHRHSSKALLPRFTKERIQTQKATAARLIT